MPANAANAHVFQINPNRTKTYRQIRNQLTALRCVIHNPSTTATATFKVQSGGGSKNARVTVTGTGSAMTELTTDLFTITVMGKSATVQYSVTEATFQARLDAALLSISQQLGYAVTQFKTYVAAGAGTISATAYAFTIEAVGAPTASSANAGLSRRPLTIGVTQAIATNATHVVTVNNAGYAPGGEALVDVIADGKAAAAVTLQPGGRMTLSYSTEPDSGTALLVGPDVSFVCSSGVVNVQCNSDFQQGFHEVTN